MNVLRSLKVSWDNRLTVGLKRTPHHFLQVRRRNKAGDNKNAYYNFEMAFLIQKNPNIHLSKLTQLTKKEGFFQCLVTKSCFVLVNSLLVVRL